MSIHVYQYRRSAVPKVQRLDAALVAHPVRGTSRMVRRSTANLARRASRLSAHISSRGSHTCGVTLHAHNFKKNCEQIIQRLLATSNGAEQPLPRRRHSPCHAAAAAPKPPPPHHQSRRLRLPLRLTPFPLTGASPPTPSVASCAQRCRRPAAAVALLRLDPKRCSVLTKTRTHLDCDSDAS
jgi:hypothetical protein